MTDITKCSGENCPMKESCYRFTAESEGIGQTYFIEPPIKDGKCEHYWERVRQLSGVSGQFKSV